MQHKAWKDITPQELEALLTQKPDLQLIDVRNPDEYQSGHIEKTTLLPLPILPLRLQEIDRDKDVIFICRSGGRSAQACEYATNQGYRNVYNLAGGMMQWPGDQVKE